VSGTARPSTVVLVAGTGTEVGKTWVGAALARAARAEGVVVAARKPAQSFDPALAEPTDADVLGDATGVPAEQVCPPGRWYEVPMAPPMAAVALGRPAPTVGDLAGELVWPGEATLGLVETAGGVRAPQADDGDAVDLARAVGVDAVVLVADAGLGTVHATRCAHEALAPLEVPVLLVLNRFDAGSALHRANLAWLRDRDRLAPSTDVTSLWRRVATLHEAHRPRS
jgi:dethiobiotin synthetase